MLRRRWIACGFAASFLGCALLSGCATVTTTVPPADYKKLPWPHTYRITTTDGEIRETSYAETHDSALVVVRPAAPLHDPRPYPVTIRYDEIESIETTRRTSILYLEAGAITGRNFGAASATYSQTRAVFELGYMGGERSAYEKRRWDAGGTFYLAASGEDSRIGVKARARYRVHRNVSFDVSAGPLFGWWDGSFINGFVGGGSVNLSPWFALRSEYMTYNAPSWKQDIGETFIEHPGGYEQVWYNGAVIRGGPAWFTLGVGAALFVALLVYFSTNPVLIPST